MWILKISGKYNDIDVETFSFIVSVEIDKALSKYSIDEVTKVIYDMIYGRIHDRNTHSMNVIVNGSCGFNITDIAMIGDLYDSIDTVLREQYSLSVISLEVIGNDNCSVVYSKG